MGRARHATVVVAGSSPTRAFEELLSAAQAVIERRPVEPVRLLFVGVGTGDVISPEYAALGALARTVTAETPILQCRAIAADGSVDVADFITQELATGEGEREVRYHNGRREVPQLEEMDLDRTRPTRLKQGGIYLLAGGAGGLGRKLADHLARRYRARMLILGRRAADRALLERMAEWRKNGAAVAYARADVTRLPEVDVAVAEARHLYGRLDGVFHLAGEVRDALYFRKDAAKTDAVIGPKLRGALNLDQATHREPLDLFVLFSSLAAVVPNPGQSCYAYANGFLDALPAWRSGRARA